MRICDECNFGTYGGRCIICGSPGKLDILFRSRVLEHFQGISDAYYCAECTRLEKDRDGCPKIVNLGASRTDLFYERRRLGPPNVSFSLKILLHVWLRFQERLALYSRSVIEYRLSFDNATIQIPKI